MIFGVGHGCIGGFFYLLFEASHDRSDSSKWTIRVLHLDCIQSNLLSWVIVSTCENGITDNHHLLERNATGIPQLLQSITLVHSFLSNIDRCGSAHVDGKSEETCSKVGLDDFAFSEIRVPVFFLSDRCLLSKCREGDLTPTIFDSFSPSLFRSKVRS